MKSKFLKLFIIHFIVVYIVISYLPSSRIILHAHPLIYFIENIRYGFFTKALISSTLSFILSFIYIKLSKK